MTNRNGSESAIGEALMMLPPIVPTLRICGEPNTETNFGELRDVLAAKV